MGKFFGKRPDRTTQIARAIASELTPSESVLAGVHVQRPGTTASAVAGGASGAVAGALSAPMTFPDGGGAGADTWRREAEQAGSDSDGVAKAIWLILVITTERVLLIRRSRLSGRPKGILAEWPLSHVEGIRVPRNGTSVHVVLQGTSLELELPLAHGFLPDVYRKLPALLQQARKESA